MPFAQTMNLHATQIRDNGGGVAAASDHPAGSPPPGPMARFSYASGARPLSGYTIKRGIGHGGFGEVYYATSDAGKEVALKLIRRNWDIELRGVTQCLNLKHPNLLSLYDVRQDEHGDNWVVMELMSGHSLEELLAKHPDGLPVDECLSWMHGIAAGVAYLHDHGIVHRDLKPGNIFIDEGIVKIGDYGLSKFISCSRRSGQTGSVGTVHYMAPEIANGRYGKEIDIYALGIILYEMLTGHVPFEGESVGEILMKHLTAEPDTSRVAEPYRTIVARCLAKDPAKRFSSVSELIALLPAPQAGAAAHYVAPKPETKSAPASEASTAQSTNKDTGFSVGAGVGRAYQSANQGDPFVSWVRDTWRDVRNWWERMNFQPWQKLAILLFGLFLAFRVVMALEFVPIGGARSGLSFGGFIVWVVVIYVVVKNVTRANARRAAGAQAAKAAQRTGAPVSAKGPSQPPPIPVRSPPRESPTRQRWRYQETALYQPPPARERLTQLIGSLLLSSIVCAVLSLVVMILAMRSQVFEANEYLWVALTSILGSWAVLIPAKLWEGRRGDVALRRFVMLVLGLGLGTIAYGLMNWLLVSLSRDGFGHGVPEFARALYFTDGSPRAIAYLAYFGTLFVIPRWWRQADPIRSTRLSIWYTAVAVFWSVASTVIWGFPQPWGWMVAATMAIAIQLASPWIPPMERVALSRPAGEAV
jgi:serine/threonine protein kinase